MTFGPPLHRTPAPGAHRRPLRTQLRTGAPDDHVGRGTRARLPPLPAARRFPLHAPHARQGRQSGARGAAARLVRGGRGPRLRQAALRGRQGPLRGRAGIRGRRARARRHSLPLCKLPRRLLRRHACKQPHWLTRICDTSSKAPKTSYYIRICPAASWQGLMPGHGRSSCLTLHALVACSITRRHSCSRMEPPRARHALECGQARR
jgi:hypothetical protein